MIIRDFLPRGSGIVTRRPLVLQLIHLPAEVKSKNDNNKEEEDGKYIYIFHNIYVALLI